MNKADKETLSAIIQTQIGVSKKLKGYQYLEDAVEIALKNPQMPVMQIYQLLGNQHGRSAVSIERTLPYDLETFLFPVHQIFYSLSGQKFIFHNQNFTIRFHVIFISLLT